MECSQSVQSLRTSDNPKFQTYQRLNKIIKELGKIRYLAPAFIASTNAVLSDDEQDDVITLLQKKKKESNYKKNHAKLLIIRHSLKDCETPESLRLSDNGKYHQYKRATNNLEKIRNNGIL